MEPGIFGQLRMEGGRPDVALSNQDRTIAHSCQDLDARTQIFELRRADEDAAQIGQLWGAGLDLRREGIDLRAIGVSNRHRVEQAEGRHRVVAHLASEKDRSRAGAEDRTTAGRKLPDGLPELLPIHSFRDRGALTAGKDQRGQAIQILLAKNRDRAGAGAIQGGGMSLHIALDRQNANPRRHGYQPRFESRSLSSRVSISIPSIALPKPRDAFRTSTGSCQWVVA